MNAGVPQRSQARSVTPVKAAKKVVAKQAKPAKRSTTPKKVVRAPVVRQAEIDINEMLGTGPVSTPKPVAAKKTPVKQAASRSASKAKAGRSASKGKVAKKVSTPKKVVKAAPQPQIDLTDLLGLAAPVRVAQKPAAKKADRSASKTKAQASKGKATAGRR